MRQCAYGTCQSHTLNTCRLIVFRGACLASQTLGAVLSAPCTSLLEQGVGKLLLAQRQLPCSKLLLSSLNTLQRGDKLSVITIVQLASGTRTRCCLC